MTLYEKIRNGFNSRTLSIIIPVGALGVFITGLASIGGLRLQSDHYRRLAETPYFHAEPIFEAKIADLNGLPCCCETPAVGIGDLTGDSLEDIALGCNSGVFLVQNEGQNRFSQPKRMITFEYSLYSNTPSISIIDVNGDSLKDVVIGDSTQVLLYRNNGLNASGEVTFREPYSK